MLLLVAFGVHVRCIPLYVLLCPAAATGHQHRSPLGPSLENRKNIARSPLGPSLENRKNIDVQRERSKPRVSLAPQQTDAQGEHSKLDLIIINNNNTITLLFISTLGENTCLQLHNYCRCITHNIDMDK